MNIKIYTVGKIQSKFHKEAIQEYAKRLTRYCKIKLIQMKDLESVQKKLTDKTYVIQVSTKGENPSSEELADKIEKLGVTGKSDVSFILCSEEMENDEHLSISLMDMELGLLTSVLYEQIYRSYRIINNQSYHK